MSQLPPSLLAAFQRWGFLADAEAHKYGLPNGATLLAKISYVETHNSTSLSITSSAGARGPMQFEPATRDAFLKKYGVDAYASVDQAVHAAALFMKTSGLSGYNPGSSSYISEVVHAPVSVGSESGAGATRSTPRSTPAPTSPAPSSASSGGTGSSLMTFGLTGALVLGGAALIALGLSRAVGSSPTAGAGEALKRASKAAGE